MDPMQQMLSELREDFRRFRSEDFSKLQDQVEEIRSFYWRVIGGGMAVSVMVSIFFELFNRGGR